MHKNYNTASGVANTRTVDQGLRNYMLKIYNYMAVGLGLTGLISYSIGLHEEFVVQMLQSNMILFLLIAQIGIVVYLSSKINKITTRTSQLLFFGYAALTGVTFSTLFVAYTGESIARVFFITAGLFGSMSIYGYITKRNLSGIGSFLRMGVFGLIIASVVNMFLQSSTMDFLISGLGVLIFTGLTAYDTQKLKHMYYEVSGHPIAENYAVIGALMLYLDFINLFLYLLRFLGDRK